MGERLEMMYVNGDSGWIRTSGTDTSCHTSFQVMAVMTASVRYHWLLVPVTLGVEEAYEASYDTYHPPAICDSFCVKGLRPLLITLTTISSHIKS